MRRRAFVFLGGSAALSACETAYQAGPPPGTQPAPPGVRGIAGPAAVLLPLTGLHSDIAQPMLEATQLALSMPGSPRLLPQDTTGTPAGAARAGQAALAAGARIILGPLTAPEVAAVTPLAQPAQIPVLAFSNDPAIGRPGVWPLGITPGQQVRRLMAAAQQAGRTRVAALLPETDFGRAMASALAEATRAAGLPAARVQFHGVGMNAIAQALRTLSDYDARQQSVQGQGELPPPPFNALLLADTGSELSEVASALGYYGIRQPAVQIMGPALWADPASRSREVSGAWFAAPDPAARQLFLQAFTARYGVAPPTVADIAYDAGAIARVTAPSDYSLAALTNPAGFAGTDGLMLLLPDGGVRRGLALFQVGPGGPQLIQPAPATLVA